MRLYFAYGLNMDQAGMARRCPGARLLGTATLEGFRFAITRLGVATVVRQAGSLVHGLVWHLAPSDERALDGFELVGARQYRKTNLPVRRANGRVRTCLVYRASDETPGRPLPGYIETVHAALGRHGLPLPTTSGPACRPRHGGRSRRSGWAPG